MDSLATNLFPVLAFIIAQALMSAAVLRSMPFWAGRSYSLSNFS